MTTMTHPLLSGDITNLFGRHTGTEGPLLSQ